VRDTVALVEQPDHRDPLRHGSRARRDGSHGLRNVDGPRLADRLAIAFRLLIRAAVAAGKGGRKDDNGADGEPHAWSGVQAS
jgi:hypothetical protein